MAYTDTVLATTPLRYWPLNETSGTSAAELVASETGTCVGLTMGGGNGPTGGTATDPGGIGGKAPLFTGTQHILLRSAALLGGLPAWTVSAWVYTTMADSLEHVFYGEMSTSAGNDQIRAAIKGPANGPVMAHTYGNDPSIVQKTSGSVFVVGYWTLVHFIWETGGNVEMWWNGGQRSALTGSSSGATWTNSSVAAWIGGPPRASNGVGFTGSIAHLFVHDRKLTAPEMSTLYRAGTPLQRTLLNKTLFKPTSVWNQKLTDPGVTPTVAANSANTVQRLVNQIATVGAATSVGGGPIWLVDNSTPTQRVRLQGGQNNFSLNHPDLYNSFGTVPIPTGFKTGVATDLESTLYNTDTDEAWEFWVMAQAFTPPEFVTASLSSGGAIPPNATQYAWVVYPADGAHAIGPGKSAGAVVTTGNQTVTLSWGTVEGATYYRIYRRLATAGSSGGNFMAEVSAATHSWVDNGSITPGASNTAAAAAVTSDWGCLYGGYIADTDLSSGVYETPHQNWGAAATSLPLYAGVVTIQEMYNGVIPHALTMAVYDTENSHVYPAQRHDFWGSLTAPGGANNIVEGTRFQLDPTYDVNQIANPFTRMLAKAFQDYGGIVRDHSGAVTAAYVEDTQALGRNPFPEVMAGRQSYELFTNPGFPWSRMRVIDPAWTLAQTSPVATVTPPFEQFSDDFEDNSINTAKWTVVGAVTETGGKLHLPVGPSPYAKVTTKGGPFSLDESSVFFKSSQRPYADLADQSGITIASEVDPVNCKISFWVESPVGVGTGGGLKFTYTNAALVATTLNAVTFDATAHAYQRVRKVGDIVYAEVSANGVTWLPFASFAWAITGWATDALHAVNATVFAGNYNAVPSRPDFIIDSFNVAASPEPPPPPAGELAVRSPADSRVPSLNFRKTKVLEISAAAGGQYTLPATDFAMQHIDLLVAPSNVTDISYPGSGSSVRFQIAPGDGVTVPFSVRVLVVGT